MCDVATDIGGLEESATTRPVTVLLVSVHVTPANAIRNTQMHCVSQVRTCWIGLMYWLAFFVDGQLLSSNAFVAGHFVSVHRMVRKSEGECSRRRHRHRWMNIS
jgi:hypothetical protein